MVTGEYPVFGASGLINNIPFYQQETDYIAIVKDGSGIGRVVFLPAKSSVIGTMQYILPKEGYNIKYIAYCLQSLDLSKYKQGAAIPHIYFRDYGERIVSVTENEQEQERIVAYLDTQFAKIDAMKANAAKALAEAKALFQSALTEAMTPKEGWEEKTLVKEFKLKSGDMLSASKQVPGPYNVYGGNGINGKHNQYNCDGLNLIIGRVGALCGNVHLVSGKCWITDNAFIVNNIDNGWFIGYLFYVLSFMDLNQYATHAAQPVISNKSMRDVKIYKPRYEVQEEIASRFSKLFSLVAALEANYTQTVAECDALKQALLREVFE